MIICDFREDFENLSNETVLFNDHPTKKSIEEICYIINTNGYNCEIFGGVKQLIDAFSQKIDLTNYVFLNMSDGLTQLYSRIQIPMLCEMLNVRYSGSPVFSVALMNNKHYSKLAVSEIHIKSPKGILINNYNHMPINFDSIDISEFPVIVKPNTEGSSIGISKKSICHNIVQLQNIIKNMANYKEIIIEKYIPGYEITNLIIGNPGDYRFNEVILTSIDDKIVLLDDVLGIKEKSLKLRKQYPASQFISADLCSKIKNYSIRIFEHFGAKDVARIDYRVTESGEIFFLEINSVPRISSTSECAIISQTYNISFEEILMQYIDAIMKRF